MEIWKDIPRTKGEYKASNLGRIMTSKTGRMLSFTVDHRGYERVRLFKTGDKVFRVHRLIAETFVPNPQSTEQVNHIDGNKRNNNASNLEWVSKIENMQHSRCNGYHLKQEQWCESKRKAIIATNIDTGEESVFESILAAKKALKTTHIQQVLKGERYVAKGYTFRYVGGGDARAEIRNDNAQ